MKPNRMQGGGFNMNAMMKQAQKLQQDMAKLQEEQMQKEYEASAGGGAVRAVVCGKTLKSLTISPDAVDPEDVEMLCDLVLAAVNEALTTAETANENEMQKLTGSVGGMGF